MLCSHVVWSTAQIILVYGVDFPDFHIALANAKIIGALALIDPPTFNVGNRMITLRDIREQLGDMVHWQGPNNLWRLLGEPVNLLLPFAESTQTWIRHSQWGDFDCFWSLVFSYGPLPIVKNDIEHLVCRVPGRTPNSQTVICAKSAFTVFADY